MKDTQEALQVQLSRFFDLHKSRLNCINSLIISLLQLRTVNLAELSLSLNDAVLSASNDKRLRRLRKKALFYQRRWEIETLFGAFNSRGFRLEQTHLTHPDRMAKWLVVVTLALAWAIIIGSGIIDHEKEIPLKNHKRKARSIFRLGLDRLKGNILTFKYLDKYIQKLSCT